MKVTSRYQLSLKQDGSNSIFAFIPFWWPPLIVLVTESSLQTVSSNDSMSHDSQHLIANHRIHINSNFVASKLCIIFRHQCNFKNVFRTRGGLKRRITELTSNSPNFRAPPT
ncbi:hypothetical protein AVEN_30919-1 [Araneus ventricosus]|uniref:Uncharacterized protein n=1 Tax=Araneus ventricosus TaxID=182803 RepID=A0A4Y2QTS8_ARAVE|nr:hypothetical protein AVEN_30919-1 [Araneus ventricosus]